jgi:dienelactone hydrolase
VAVKLSKNKHITKSTNGLQNVSRLFAKKRKSHVNFSAVMQVKLRHMKMLSFRTSVLTSIGCLLYLISVSLMAAVYDPAITPYNSKFNTMDVTIHDNSGARDIPIKIYLPDATAPTPIILYSHGLGGSREESSYLAKHWAARGYTVVYHQHPGSDIDIWKNIPERRRFKRFMAMKKGISYQNFILRVEDVDRVLEQLDKWNQTEGHELEGRLDLKKVGMSGHSFGARTAQAVGGQAFTESNDKFTNSRITAALLMSPSSPKGSSKDAFGTVSIPWMLMTGTNDTAPFGRNSDATTRLTIFPALPSGGKYELVLYNAEHLAFTDHALKDSSEPRNPNHHKVILGLSTAFWDAYLREDDAAMVWLDGEGPESVLHKHDTWQKK